MPRKVTARPKVLAKASLAARSMAGAYQRIGRRCRSLGRAVVARSAAPLPGEVPERLNGRDWKSRNGGQPRSRVRIPPSPCRPRVWRRRAHRMAECYRLDTHQFAMTIANGKKETDQVADSPPDA